MNEYRVDMFDNDHPVLVQYLSKLIYADELVIDAEVDDVRHLHGSAINGLDWLGIGGIILAGCDWLHAIVINARFVKLKTVCRQFLLAQLLIIELQLTIQRYCDGLLICDLIERHAKSLCTINLIECLPSDGHDCIISALKQCTQMISLKVTINVLYSIKIYQIERPVIPFDEPKNIEGWYDQFYLSLAAVGESLYSLNFEAPPPMKYFPPELPWTDEQMTAWTHLTRFESKVPFNYQQLLSPSFACTSFMRMFRV